MVLPRSSRYSHHMTYLRFRDLSHLLTSKAPTSKLFPLFLFKIGIESLGCCISLMSPLAAQPQKTEQKTLLEFVEPCP